MILSLKSKSQQIEELVKANPNRFLAIEIAKQVGVSRERVRQITTTELPELRSLLGKKQRKIFVCQICGKEVSHQRKLCWKCFWKKNEAPRAEFVCLVCGKVFVRKLSETKRNKNTFCSGQCLGVYISQHYGLRITKNTRKGQMIMKKKPEDYEFSVVKIQDVPRQGRSLSPLTVFIENKVKSLPEGDVLKVKCRSISEASSIRRKLKLPGLNATVRAITGEYFLFVWSKITH